MQNKQKGKGKNKYIVKIIKKDKISPYSLGGFTYTIVSYLITAIPLAFIFHSLNLNIGGLPIGILYYGLLFVISTTVVYPLITRSITIKYDKKTD